MAPAREIDEVTLRRAQRGDAAACRALVLMYQDRVVGLCARIIGRADRSAAEDAAQETFVAAFAQLQKFTPLGPARLSTWMLTIAARRAIDAQRQLAATQRMHDEVQVRAANASAAPLVNDWIASALAELTAEHRAVLLLNDVYEFEQREIAKALAIEIGTVKSRLARARAAMRARAPQQARLA